MSIYKPKILPKKTNDFPQVVDLYESHNGLDGLPRAGFHLVVGLFSSEWTVSKKPLMRSIYAVIYHPGRGGVYREENDARIARVCADRRLCPFTFPMFFFLSLKSKLKRYVLFLVGLVIVLASSFKLQSYEK